MEEEYSGAQALVKSLESKDVNTIFGYPGGANLPLYDALRDSKILNILARHEQGAIHMADGYARVAGLPGVCLATSGPGVTNFITGLANALLDSVPMLAISGQIPTQFVGTDAFQEVDCFNITMPVTKHNELILDVEEITTSIDSGYHIANSGRKGPVLLDYPKDILLKKFTPDFNKRRELPGYHPNEKGHIGQIKKALKLIGKADRPLILIGGGILNAKAKSEFLQLLKILRIPVVRTLMGKGVINDDDPLFIGMIGTHGNVEGNKAVNKADVIFAIGTRLGDRTTFGTQNQDDKFAKNAKFIHLDIDPAEIGKNKFIDIPIVGDIKEVFHDIFSELEKRPLLDRLPWVTVKNRNTILSKQDHAHWMQMVFEELSKINEGLHISTDVGRHQMWATHYCTNPKHLPLLTSGGLGTMGFGLPAAIGAWFADRSKPTINITGDGSFMMSMQEFAVAVENKVPLVVVLINDFRLGMIRELQDSSYGGRHAAHTFNRNMNFKMIAEAMGGVGVDITLQNQIAPALKKSIASGKPTILNFDIEKLENSSHLNLEATVNHFSS